MPQARGRADAQVENQTSKPSHGTSLTNEASQRILNDKIIEKLDKIVQKNGAESIRTVDATNYTPEAVSNRILNFVQEAINRAGARGEKQAAMVEQAKAGINKGFKDAENILTSLNALSGAIAENVNKTYELIQNGMQDVVNKIRHNTNAGGIIETGHYASAVQSSSQSLNLEIKTQDGDLINLSLSRDETTGKYVAQVANANGEAKYSEQNYELNENFSLSVQGSLDESEVAAIEELLGGVKGVADQFFDGNSEAALEAGLNLGYNTGEIASFSLSLDESQTSSVTKAYQEVSYLGNGHGKPHQDALNNILKPVNGFMNSLHGLLNSSEQSKMFDDPKANIEELLSFFSKSDESHKPAINSLEAKAGAPFENIVHDLVSQLS